MGFSVSTLQECWRDARANAQYQRKGYPIKREQDQEHLAATMDWLLRCIEQGKGGCAGHYSLLTSDWTNPFPETTGYIIPTLLDYASQRPDLGLEANANVLAEWLAKVQLPSGACMQGLYNVDQPNTTPVIFNTGQNLLGYNRLLTINPTDIVQTAAQKSADFLVQSAGENGVWEKGLLRGLKHTINTRSAWALLGYNEIESKPQYAEVAHANLQWTCDQQTANFWFKNGSSREGGLPNTHFLAYTCRGLVESYRISHESRYLEVAEKTAGKMLQIFRERGMLYAFWDENWQNQKRKGRPGGASFICLTGCAQIAMVWMRLFQIRQDKQYLEAAVDMLDHIKALQYLDHSNPGYRGGIKGSFPVYGGYATMRFPNWAAKFFADAIMMKQEILSQ